MNAARPLVASKLFHPVVTGGVLMLVAGLAAAFAAEPARRATGDATPSSRLAEIPVKLPPPTWPWRQTLEQEIAVQPTVHPATAPSTPQRERLSPLLLHAEPDTSDLITLPPLRVSGSRLEQEVKREYAIAKQRAQDAAVLRRLGTGLHEVGHSHFGILTVFYIPVFAGFGWSW